MAGVVCFPRGDILSTYIYNFILTNAHEIVLHESCVCSTILILHRIFGATFCTVDGGRMLMCSYNTCIGVAFSLAFL